jgi:hypothetical protein
MLPMKRPKLNFIIDIIAFFAFVLLTTTGILMRYILPPGSGKYALIWNMDRHEWGTIHFWISILFFSILALHLFTHWKWIVSLVKGRPKDQTGYRAGLGIVGVLAIILLSIAPLLTPIENTSENKNNTENHDSSDEHDIRGSMTLNEIEQVTNVPVEFIIKSLKLPVSVARDEKLGYLKNEYGFDMNELRTIIENYTHK